MKITMSKEQVILSFINQFRAFGPGVEECFSNGMCFHFARILHMRFQDEETHLLYDQIIGHFATEINGRVYDITGDITDDQRYKWDNWHSLRYKDIALAKRIHRDCDWKVPSGLVLCEFCGRSYLDDWGTLICGCDNHPVTGNDSCEKGEING